MTNCPWCVEYMEHPASLLGILSPTCCMNTASWGIYNYTGVSGTASWSPGFCSQEIQVLPCRSLSPHIHPPVLLPGIPNTLPGVLTEHCLHGVQNTLVLSSCCWGPGQGPRVQRTTCMDHWVKCTKSFEHSLWRHDPWVWLTGRDPHLHPQHLIMNHYYLRPGVFLPAIWPPVQHLPQNSSTLQQQCHIYWTPTAYWAQWYLDTYCVLGMLVTLTPTVCWAWWKSCSLVMIAKDRICFLDLGLA